MKHATSDPTDVTTPAEKLAKALRESGWQMTSYRLTWDNARPTTRYRHIKAAEALLAEVFGVQS